MSTDPPGGLDPADPPDGPASSEQPASRQEPPIPPMRAGVTVVVPDHLALVAGQTADLLVRLGELGGGRLSVSSGPVPAEHGDDPWAFLHVDADAAQDAVDLFPGCWVYRTDVHVVWDRTEGQRPSISRTVLLQRHPGIDHPEFVQRWTVGHAALATEHHPGICRYVQRVVVERLTDETPPADGIACLAYASTDDFELRQYDSPEGQAIIQQDVARFLDRTAGRRIVGRERDVVESALPPPD